MKGPTIDQLLELGEQHARRILIGGKEELVPMFHLVYPDGASMVIGAPWHNGAEKDATVNAIRAAMQLRDVIRYGFVCEAWTVHLAPGEPMPNIRPSESPNRIEMVCVTACDLKQQKMAGFAIKRDKRGYCLDLVRLEGETQEVTGTIAEMLQ